MKKRSFGKAFSKLACALLSLSVCFSAFITVSSGEDRSAEESMYLYTVEISLYNPCNSNDMDKDAVCELWFDFAYKSANGYGKSGNYRLDMSWKNGKNLNADILKKCFIRANDNECMTSFSVWVPGTVDKVSVHLNMDGGERLGFRITGVTLAGFRVNTDTDYVSSAYYDSNAEIPCRVPSAALTGTEEGSRDQYSGLFTKDNAKKAKDKLASGDADMFYHYEMKK